LTYLLFYGAHFGQFGQIGKHWVSRPNTTNNIKMKKVLDYVSDYQLKSACKDAICIALSKDYPNDLCCFRGLIYRIVLTHTVVNS